MFVINANRYFITGGAGFIGSHLVEVTRLFGVKFRYTGGNRGWPSDVPQMRFDITKITRLSWKTMYNSDEAVEQANNVLYLGFIG